MGKKEGTAIVFMGIGILAIYLGVSGHLQSFWTGLTGGYGDGDDSGGGGGASGSAKDTIPPTPDILEGLSQEDIDRIKNNIGPKAGAGDPNPGTGLSQPVGAYYVLPTGTMAQSDAGIY